MAWSAVQYLKFEDERSRPARDLLSALPDIAPRTAYDLGCGPGNSTALVKQRFPDATLTGIDLDENMLDEARRRMPETRFMQADLSGWRPAEQADLIFSNATFQWLPNHLNILAELAEALPHGGTLAVQMPDNLSEPTHLLMEETALHGPWRENFLQNSARRTPLPGPEAYYQRLVKAGCKVDLFHIVYHHPLAGAAAIVEWVKGTGLRPYLDRVPTDLQADFLGDYQSRIAAAYPAMADGQVLLRFPRLFIIATRLT
ncbi:trans-aconitate 2-methyltransferase [Martelella alba]|uniref:Trans-aconitate 2-methyltransferase n=1 Tax=Martelella alba TaxID=2590451 RepID=A0A506UAN2_9HYPH|nr:trans-aconitate 2-methyltransferase [Martelella alba]TPW30578.1 trans-aconitate 2-methyltransferase [Martelella alba]